MKFTSTIIAALIAAALTGQATGIKLKADATWVTPEGETTSDY